MKNTIREKGSSYWHLAWIVPLVVSLWWAVTWVLTSSCEKLPEKGQTGDMFGGVNALFSGLAFGILIFTMHLQRKELELQRVESAQSREEFRGQKEQLEKQNRVLAIQSFENTFFHLVDLHRAQVKDAMICEIGLRGSAKSHEGLDAFGYLKDVLFLSMGPTNLYNNQRSDWENWSYATGKYEEIYDLNEAVLSGYFRLLYNIVVLVDTADILAETEKRKYIRVLRSQLVDAELVVLFFNCLSEYGRKFKPYIERYALLKHLQADSAHFWPLKKMYDPRAFGAIDESKTT